jgi:hypothetical protein
MRIVSYSFVACLAFIAMYTCSNRLFSQDCTCLDDTCNLCDKDNPKGHTGTCCQSSLFYHCDTYEYMDEKDRVPFTDQTIQCGDLYNVDSRGECNMVITYGGCGGNSAVGECSD